MSQVKWDTDPGVIVALEIQREQRNRDRGWINASKEVPPGDRHLLLAWNLDPEDGFDYGFGTPGEYDHTVECIRQGCVTHWMILPEPPER